MIYSDYATYPMPCSLPELSSSKSSKSSSFHSSYQSDDNTILTYLGNFEDIVLDDADNTEIGDFSVKPPTDFLDEHDQGHLQLGFSEWSKPRSITSRKKIQGDFIIGKPDLFCSGPISNADYVRNAPYSNLSPRPTSTFRPVPSPTYSFVSRSREELSTIRNCLKPYPKSSLHRRRSAWQINRERKTVQELEKEFDEDVGDDVPDECFLENVPLSPSLVSELIHLSPKSASTMSHKQPTLEETKLSELNAPAGKECPQTLMIDLDQRRSITPGITSPDSFKARPKSWIAAMSDLDKETKQLTEALEVYQVDSNRKTATLNSIPRESKSNSTFVDLPPLRRADNMVDPLPISREKEAVLSRTRPSWLPPKNPAEEIRHLKEYQKMMAQSLEADRRKETSRRDKAECRDDAAKSLLKIWEEHVLPNWDTSIRQRRTRELWWRGIAPRSRGDVWKKAIGNELGLKDASYTAALQRAKALEKAIKSGAPLTSDEEKKKYWFHQIHHDVAKTTYPELRIFQPEGPLHSSLVDILKAYTMYRSDVGYVYGISTCAALLLLNLSTPAAVFIALSNLLNRPLPLSLYTSDTEATQRAFSLLFSTLRCKSPRLYKHLESLKLKASRETIFRDFFTSMGTAYLTLDNATRLWDIMLFEGDSIVARAAAAYFLNIEAQLFSADSYEQMLEIKKNSLAVGEEEWVNSIRRAY